MCDQHLLLTNHYTIATLAWWWWRSSNYKAISQINWNFAPAALTIAFDTHRAQPPNFHTANFKFQQFLTQVCSALVATTNAKPAAWTRFLFFLCDDSAFTIINHRTFVAFLPACPLCSLSLLRGSRQITASLIDPRLFASPYCVSSASPSNLPYALDLLCFVGRVFLALVF